jgi:hypothetical protein
MKRNRWQSGTPLTSNNQELGDRHETGIDPVVGFF